MNNLEIFRSPEFGQVRTVVINSEPWLVGKDIAIALGYKNPTVALQDNVDNEDKVVTKVSTLGGMQDTIVINESGMYSLVFGSKLPSAKRFKHWVTSEVLPSIRKTGTYQKPLTQLEIIQKSVELLQEHDERLDKLEFDIPLYGCESKELSDHVKRKGVQVLGGKNTNAYKDTGIRTSVYRDIYDQLKREFGLYDDVGRKQTYLWLKRKHLADAHEFIDCYDAPMYLQEQIESVNNSVCLV